MKQKNGRYKNWLSFSGEDLLSARVLFNEGIYNQACFHAQQSAEKSLKAFLKFSGQLPPRIHSLSKLLILCRQLNKSFARFDDVCLGLDRFYVPTRYPDAMIGSLPNGLPNKEDAKKAVTESEDIHEFVLKLIDNA